MTLIGGGIVGGYPGGSMRFSQTRGRMSNQASQGVYYPSPFFDIAHTYLPITVKQLFRWCRYYFLTNPLINAIIFKMSEYPVTEMIFEHESKMVVNRWTEYFQDHLRYRPFQIECGLDFFTYGNCLPSLSLPFKKFIRCRNCGFQEEAKRIRPYWVLTNYEFRLSCPKCQQVGTADAYDWYMKNASGIRMMRWSPEDVEISYSDVTGEFTYFYNIPPSVRNDIIVGKKDAVEKVPQVFIQAMRQQKGVVFNEDMFFHLRRPTLADQDRGWGTPLILPVLKDTFYLQIMKKAQEAILLEHIVPLRVLFPQPSTGASDPYTTVNLVDWRDHVASEIARWRYDPNYIPIFPLPIGNQTIGGDGRALLLTQEIQQWSEQIINGMQVPLEFIKGGLSYAGTNVSMRMLENAFLGYIIRHKQLANWVMRQIAHYMEWPEAHIRFKPFKMADDIQRKAYLFQLNTAGKVSDRTLLADADLDQEEEDEAMLNETAMRIKATEKQQLALAEMQGKQQVIMMKHQAKAQQALMEAQAGPQAPGEPGDAMIGGQQQQQQAQPAIPGAPPPPSVPGMPGQQQPTAGPGAGVPVPQGLEAMQSPLNAGQDMGMNQPQPGQQPMMGGTDITVMASSIAQQLAQLDPAQQHLAIKNLRQQSPELADLVLQYLASMGGMQQQVQGVLGAQGRAATEVNMKPLPEKLPPRRAAGIV
jgi:hypothetical protein